eukprot:m.1040431 g.1040431  ORF g.1040431 m.1040431 type:complete len:965 (+) comp24155_c0_seq5:251-3145(+)
MIDSKSAQRMIEHNLDFEEAESQELLPKRRRTCEESNASPGDTPFLNSDDCTVVNTVESPNGAKAEPTLFTSSAEGVPGGEVDNAYDHTKDSASISDDSEEEVESEQEDCSASGSEGEEFCDESDDDAKDFAEESDISKSNANRKTRNSISAKSVQSSHKSHTSGDQETSGTPEKLDDDVDGYSRAPPFSEEYLRRQRNIAMLKRGEVLVERETVMPHLLHLSAAERKCYAPFRAHVHLRTPQSAALGKKKTLGMRGMRGFKTSAFAAVASKDGAGPVVPPPAKKPCEPLVLWKPPVDGSAHEHVAPIEVDNFICHWLRPHQRTGVQFLFDCVTGAKDFEGEGCILADDMGLGKTLMSITLIWMVLKHSFEGPEGPKICKRVVVCCPTSLVFNWNNEITKWLQRYVKCIAVGNSGSSILRDVQDFASARPSAPVLIISYETFRNHKQYFYGENKVDLLICDEAHRLKNDATQTSVMLAGLTTRKRVLLSGTPLQNRLDEFFAMVNFCNPGVLGTVAQFRKKFERPILAGMEPDCTDEDTAKAKQASDDLSAISNLFILRRTNTLLAKHLPTKLIEVVCCKPTPLQVQLYNHFLKSKEVTKALRESDDQKAGFGQVLGIIQSLSKLCNHPRLVYPSEYTSSGTGRSAKGSKKADLNKTFNSCAHLFPDDFDVRGDSRCFVGGMQSRRPMRGNRQQEAASGDGGIMSELSGKMVVLDRLLCQMRRKGDERIVVVSNYTQTLDQIMMMCRERFFPVVRLDGSMSGKKRRILVEDFNDKTKDQFVFLLSSKAGGCGLNLIGGNRLVLFDPDWNPATDKQAAARVWRDGQKRRCYVYRFLTSGTIEEKVFQRQMSKEGLQSIVVDDKMTVNAQSAEDLRNIFQLDDTDSSTHDSLKCKRCSDDTDGCCEKDGTEDALQTWAHHKNGHGVKDKVMQRAAGDDVAFIFSLKIPGQRFEGFRCEDDTDTEES